MRAHEAGVLHADGYGGPPIYLPFPDDVMALTPALWSRTVRRRDDGVLEVKYALPYSDLVSLSEEQLQLYLDDLQPLEFSHTLEDQIGGQIDAGFAITGFYEDKWTGTKLAEYMPTFIATRGTKQG